MKYPRLSLTVLALLFGGMGQAGAAIVLSEASRTGFNGFEIGPVDAYHGTDGTVPYREGIIQVRLDPRGGFSAMGGVPIEGIGGWDGAWNNYGITSITLSGGLLFERVGFLVSSSRGGPGTSVRQDYALLHNGERVFSSSLDITGRVAYLGFSGGTFDEIQLSQLTHNYDGIDYADGFHLDSIETAAAEVGDDPHNPVLPQPHTNSGDPRGNGSTNHVQIEGHSGAWFDPPATSGFQYTMTGGSLFTSILDFPTGFNSPFDVFTGNTFLGAFGPGQSVTFPGGGVSQFRVTGIDPLVDGGDPRAFPLQLAFNTETASFDMEALPAASVPEPTSLVIFGVGTVTCAAFGLRRRKRAA